jgi:hypothetical protein
MRELVFGAHGEGTVTYMVLEREREVGTGGGVPGSVTFHGRLRRFWTSGIASTPERRGP